MREWWARVRQNDNFLEAVFWGVQLIPAEIFGYIFSIRYLSYLSVYALIKACMATHHGKKNREETDAGK